MHKPRTQQRDANSNSLNALNSEMQPLFARVLAARGVNSANEMNYSLNQLLPPKGLRFIDDAAHLLSEAVVADASIVIVGDFDADGATSCAVAVRCLKSFGLQNVSYLVPNRFEYGYGLSPEIVGVAATRHPDIIITVDNGISSIDGVYAAQQLGMVVMVTDHHLPADELPSAEVIVNPNLPGDRFASKNLAGVGVIFYVMLALRARLRQMNWFQESGNAEPNMSQFLDLVALGTVADVVPLDKNNRILVQQGLQRIQQGNGCAGINALLTVGKKNPKRVVATDLGFTVGPRLNAAGRLEDISLGIECLLTDDPDRAMALALQLDEINRNRREVESTMQADAQKIVEGINLEGDIPSIYALYDESWHQGVVGLLASRVKERTHRPVLAFAPSDKEGELKGSARSIEGIHMRDLLARVDALHPNLIGKFGGHAMAAGLSIDASKLAKFQSVLESVLAEFCKDFDWQQTIWTDGELNDAEFTREIAEQLKDITPWGQAFPEPLFEGGFEVIDARFVGEVHAKMKLRPTNSNKEIDAICFFYQDKYGELPQGEKRMTYKLDVNEWQDRRSLQLLIEHVD